MYGVGGSCLKRFTIFVMMMHGYVLELHAIEVCDEAEGFAQSKD
jgi:hypothetical protein